MNSLNEAEQKFYKGLDNQGLLMWHEHYYIQFKENKNNKDSTKFETIKDIYVFIVNEIKERNLEIPNCEENYQNYLKEQEEEKIKNEKLEKMTKLERQICEIKETLKELTLDKLNEGYRQFCKEYKKNLDKYGMMEKTKKNYLLLKECEKLYSEEFNNRGAEKPDFGLNDLKITNVHNAILPLYDLLAKDIECFDNEQLLNNYKNNIKNLNQNLEKENRYTFWDFMHSLLVKEINKRKIEIKLVI